MSQLQFIDLGAQQSRIKDKIDENIQRVLAHGKYIMGPEVGQLETHLKAFTGTRHAVACGSGTDALLLALMAFDVGPGDAGIPSAIYYPKPLHLQAAFQSLRYNEGAFPISEDCAKRIFSIPMHPYLTIEDQEKIVQVFQ